MASEGPDPIIVYNTDFPPTSPNNLTFLAQDLSNWWALSALGLVLGTAAGNILVCLAICWERRLQNVTNYFLMSLAVTDLMVAILVMPLGIYTLFRGYFALPSIYCLAWICLDVLFCTASIMHLCTISVDRYLSLRYPMKFGRNKSRRRVILKIIFVWLLSIAMSLPLSLMYSKDQGSLIVDGTCQIPDPLYKFIGSIICFYIPLLVMLVTYALTVSLLANQKQSLGTPDWSSNWMGGPTTAPLERKCTWRKFLNSPKPGGGSKLSTPQHGHSAASTDTELTTLDTHDLWIQESDPKPFALSALGQFGAEMLKLSRGLEAAAAGSCQSSMPPQMHVGQSPRKGFKMGSEDRSIDSLSDSHSPLLPPSDPYQWRRRASTFHEGDTKDETPSPSWRKRAAASCEPLPCIEPETTIAPTESDSYPLPPPCTCPYFGTKAEKAPMPTELRIVPSETLQVPASSKLSVEATCPSLMPPASPKMKSSLARSRGGSGDSSPNNIVVTWEARKSHKRGSSMGTTRSTLSTTSSMGGTHRTPLLLRRSATLRQNGHVSSMADKSKNPSSPCLLQRYNYTSRSVRRHHSRNASIISRNSSRHGRIIRLEQKATKVLGVVFFTFVILWAPFFILNLLPTFCSECDKNLDNWMVQLVTWLGYASSMVNPIFYTIFNKVFRQAFKKVLTCKYRRTTWRPHR